MDDLEPRALLSIAPMLAHTTFEIRPLAGGGGPSAPYTPAQLQQAYGFNSITFNGVAGTGSGETIAIVDAYNDPNIQSDLNTFDTEFGLLPTTVAVSNETGGTSLPASDPTGGWELEESLDVEWAHAMAPGASIMLVEANSTSDNDLLAAVQYGASHANVVSMSWGGGEWSGETAYDSYFDHAGVAFVASSGDDGAPPIWPAASPNVLSVGGTALTLGPGNVWSSEVGWSDSGGGPSAYESQPPYQKGVVTQTSSARPTPDVAYDASPSTGVYVYDSVPYEGGSGWWEVGGTSAGAPQWSALLAIADQGRALSGQPALNSSSPQQVMSILYANPADFHDITSGTSTGNPQYSAGPGYDYVTGMGSPIANLIVGSLDGTSTASYDKLVLSETAPTTAETAGKSFSLTVTAQKSSGATDTGYLGTIQFTSSDVQAGLPANFTFTAADDGAYTFPVTLKTAGSQSVTATDTTTSAITGTLSGISVSPASASQFVLSGLPSTATVGVAQTLTVTAEDPYGNVATGYTGTVHFTSSDPQASLPANYTFTSANDGVHAFTLTFGTAGTQSVTVKDTSSGITATQSGITVAPAAPTNLVASAVSSTQIKLTWTGSNGATGYLIQQSLNGSTGWTQVGSTSGSTTTFQQTGLSAGTTYYYRVIATAGAAGAIDSAYSNVASATTSGTAATPDSLWGNSYVASENYYSYGSYELGVKFTASVAGEVTGVRFYKQTWMGGYVHVGHLWSSTGTVLATATFTNESAYGWQQVNFSSPVAIQANTVYIASFSTGGGYFGITSPFFTSSGVISGPLQALSNSVAGGDGVYNRAGYFPDVDGNGMNFWADVAFTPSSSSSNTAKAPSPASHSHALGGFGSNASTSDQPSHFFISAPPTTPAGPARHAAGWRGTTPAVLGSLSYRLPIPQAATLASWLKKPFLASGSI
jgi:subtilase family serine protease